jgi:hypothetical protein
MPSSVNASTGPILQAVDVDRGDSLGPRPRVRIARDPPTGVLNVRQAIPVICDCRALKVVLSALPSAPAIEPPRASVEDRRHMAQFRRRSRKPSHSATQVPQSQLLGQFVGSNSGMEGAPTALLDRSV